jgi:hypothetical protein
MVKHKKAKPKVKERIGKSLSPAVPAELILQKFETSKTIKNYNTAGVPYDKQIYNKYIRNLDAQKLASKYDSPALKVNLKYKGDVLYDKLKKSVGNPSTFTGSAVEYVEPIVQQPSTQPVSVPVEVVNDAERDILNILSRPKYRLKKDRPTQATINAWARRYAGGDKGLVVDILNRHYAAEQRRQTDKFINQQNVNYAGVRAQLAQSRLKREQDARQSSSAPPPAAQKPIASVVVKNKLIDEKLKKLDLTKPIPNSTIKRWVGQKGFKEVGITNEDINKRVKTMARRNQKKKMWS